MRRYVAYLGAFMKGYRDSVTSHWIDVLGEKEVRSCCLRAKREQRKYMPNSLDSGPENATRGAATERVVEERMYLIGSSAPRWTAGWLAD
jgi:hypothetical protein